MPAVNTWPHMVFGGLSGCILTFEFEPRLTWQTRKAEATFSGLFLLALHHMWSGGAMQCMWLPQQIHNTLNTCPLLHYTIILTKLKHTHYPICASSAVKRKQQRHNMISVVTFVTDLTPTNMWKHMGSRSQVFLPLRLHENSVLMQNIWI